MLLLSLIFVYDVVYSAIPLSNPNDPSYEKVYNMIDARPLCYREGICPGSFAPGSRYGVFPNGEERQQHQMKNMFRMFANASLNTSLGRWRFGANTMGGKTRYDPCDFCMCGTTHRKRRVMYWYSPANQAARFKQWDENQCDPCYFFANNWKCDESNDGFARPECFPSVNGITGCGGAGPHDTCDWNKDGNSNCDIYMDGDCDPGSRLVTFAGLGVEDGIDWYTEGICGGNTCYADSHCDPIFHPSSDFMGNGFMAGTNGVGTEYLKNGDEMQYKLSGASHYDERIKVIPEELNSLGKYVGLTLQYTDRNKTILPTACYALFNEQYFEMDILIQYAANPWEIFYDHHFYPVTQCEPYAFICKTTANQFIRLPEDYHYYFGTDWLDWSWSNYASFGDGYLCKEYHYFYDETDDEWIANGGPWLAKTNIYHYKEGNLCEGCNHINSLNCWADCITHDFAPLWCDGCGNVTASPTPPPVVKPTRPPNEPPTAIPTTTTSLTPNQTLDISIDSDSAESDDTGAIVAGVLVPLLCIIGLGIAGFIFWKKREGESTKTNLGTSHTTNGGGKSPKSFGSKLGVRRQSSTHVKVPSFDGKGVDLAKEMEKTTDKWGPKKSKKEQKNEVTWVS